MLAKAELHVHIECSMLPIMARRIAEKNKIALPNYIAKDDNTYQWKGFTGFLDAYDLASYVFRTVEDYRDLVYYYLEHAATEGAIYVEMLVSPDHAAMCGIAYKEMLSGMAQGIEDAYNDFAIVGRIQIMCVRNFGVDSCIRIAKDAVRNPHPYVVGFTMGGDEVNYPPHDYVKAYQIAHDAGLGCSIHAGEMAGPGSVLDAISFLPIQRIGHGIRAIEDPKVVSLIIEKNITLEVCLSSNIALSVYPDLKSHPFVKLQKAGVTLTLNTDDPPFFNTSISKEYAIAKNTFHLSDEDLTQITKQAITASFADDHTKEYLLKKLADLNSSLYNKNTRGSE